MTRPAPRLIGISGRARSGKSTFAQALVEHDDYELVSFAEPIRQMLHEQNPVITVAGSFQRWHLQDIVLVYGWEKAKDLYPEIRRMLQTLGTDAGRNVLGEDVWVNAAMRAVDADINKPIYGLPRFVFPDVRFQNEFDAIKKRGGIVVRVERSDVKDNTPMHESENSIDDAEFDYVIHNDGSVADLRQKAFDVVAKEMGTYVWPTPPQYRCVIVPKDVRVFRSQYDLDYFTEHEERFFPGRVCWVSDGGPAPRYPELFESNNKQASVRTESIVTENGMAFGTNGHSRRDYR